MRQAVLAALLTLTREQYRIVSQVIISEGHLQLYSSKAPHNIVIFHCSCFCSLFILAVCH
jgi:hypothetical protein